MTALYASDLPEGLAEFMAANTSRSDGCWHWRGSTNGNGYGRFSYRGVHVYAHRAALALKVGVIPSGMFACHSCDNPPCVNPAHLSVGTQADNMRGAAERGRTRNAPRRGVDHHAVTVEAGAIAEAITRYAQGGYSQAELADELGVAQATFGRWARAEARPDVGMSGVTATKGRRLGVPLKPCGTHAAYARHLRNGEKACQACLAAERSHCAEQRERRASRRHPSSATTPAPRGS